MTVSWSSYNHRLQTFVVIEFLGLGRTEERDPLQIQFLGYGCPFRIIILHNVFELDLWIGQNVVQMNAASSSKSEKAKCNGFLILAVGGLVSRVSKCKSFEIATKKGKIICDQ